MLVFLVTALRGPATPEAIPVPSALDAPGQGVAVAHVTTDPYR